MIEVIVAALVAFILGYVTRKYVEKKYPDEAARLDAKAKYYGEDLQDRAEDAYKKAQDSLRK